MKLEQRQETLELQLRDSQQGPPAEEVKMLDGVDQLIRECQELLDSSFPNVESEKSSLASQEEDILAA